MILPDDKYEVLQPLKEGGMGAIYKVRHRLLDEIRVVKLMRPYASQDPELRNRFLREAKMAIRVRHPNIGQLYDFSIDDEGTAIIVMEFIDGVTLQEVLRGDLRPSVPFVIEVAIQTLQALSCLHFNDIVHRDVASDNVMLTQSFDGHLLVKLIDLGIAKDPRSDATETLSGTFLGKARYASPEQFRGDRADRPTAATDLYAFGVLLYELLTGRLPFEGSTFAELAAGHLFQPPIPFAKTDPNERIPPGLREIILHALEKDPARRIASAQTFADSIRPYGSPGGADPGELERFVKRLRAANPASVALDDPRMNAVVDALMAPFSDPVALEILDVVHGHVAERPAAAAAEPAPVEHKRGRDVDFAPRPGRVEHEDVELEAGDRAEEKEDEEKAQGTGQRPAAHRRPQRSPPQRRRRFVPFVAVGLLLVGAAVFAFWKTRDPLAGQIATVLGLEANTETAVNDKLKRVAALIDLLPEEDSRKQALGAERDRLAVLYEMHTYVDRLERLLNDAPNPAGEAEEVERAAVTAESLWNLMRDHRTTFAPDDPAASLLESQARDVLREIGERIDSEPLRRLAEAS